LGILHSFPIGTIGYPLRAFNAVHNLATGFLCEECDDPIDIEEPAKFISRWPTWSGQSFSELSVETRSMVHFASLATV
jgi:hypothetical protein